MLTTSVRHEKVFYVVVKFISFCLKYVIRKEILNTKKPENKRKAEDRKNNFDLHDLVKFRK